MNSLPQIGEIVDGTYELTGVLGRGGFGAVYRARQLNMERDVALKLLTASGPKFGEMVKRFRREVMAIRNLTHPNTVTIYDFHDDPEGLLYYTMEALNGQTLKAEVRENGPLSPKRLRHVLIQVLKSLSEAHSYNIVHRDLKPSNIMLVEMHGETDFVKVLDFGIAKMLHDEADDEEHMEQLTSAGVLVGTLKYMAPEQISGEDLGAYTDLYALGLIAVEMLTGESIYSGSGRWEVLRQQVSDEPVDIPDAVLHSSIGPILRQCLNKNQQERYRTAQELLDDLNALDSTRLEDYPLYVSDGFDGWVPRGDAQEPDTIDDFSAEGAGLKTVIIDAPVGGGDKTEVTPMPHHGPEFSESHSGEFVSGSVGGAGLQAVSSPSVDHGVGHDGAGGGGWDSGVDVSDSQVGGHSYGTDPSTGPAQQAAQGAGSAMRTGDNSSITGEVSDLYPEVRANELARGTVVHEEGGKSKGKKIILLLGALVMVVGVAGAGAWVMLDDGGQAQQAEHMAAGAIDDDAEADEEEEGADDEDEVAAGDEDDVETHEVTIEVENEDLRARVFIDDEFVGRTPRTVDFEDDSVALRLEARDFEDLEAELDWDSPSTMEFKLEPDEEERAVADRGQSDSDDSDEEEVGSSASDDRGGTGGSQPSPPPPPEPDPTPSAEEESSDSDDGWVDIRRGGDADEEEEEEEERTREVPLF